MIENDDRAQATAILTEALQGNFISRFSVGDTWDLYLGGYWLTAHDVISADETPLNEWYQENYHAFPTSVDKQNISKATIISAHLQKTVIAVSLDEECNLTLHFEEDSKLTFPTNVDIVDWQWGLNTTGSDPYTDYIVACFDAGTIAVAEITE